MTVILIGIPHLGEVDYLAKPLGFAGVLQAAALVFFAYIGFEDVVKLAEETHRPHVNIPRGLLIAMVLSTLLYLLVAVAAVSVLPWETLAASPAPFAAIVETALGTAGAEAMHRYAKRKPTGCSPFITILISLGSASRIS